MEVGIVGLPGVGKTALFEALVAAATAPGGGQKVNIGVASIPDPRLLSIAGFIEPKKITHATIQLVDIPGLDTGLGAEKAAALLAQVRTVDALCHVVRCFDVPGLGASRTDDPTADINALNDEMLLADLSVAEPALDRARRPARSGDAEAKTRVSILERVVEALSGGEPVRSLTGWSAIERPLLRSYGFTTAKSVLYVANTAEDDPAGLTEAPRKVIQHAQAEGGEAITVCAKLEAELARLEDADRCEMLEGLGLTEPAIGPLARALNRVLGLVIFYTAGPKEVRAWPVTADATAPQAAGTVHSDMERGFIRAECYHYDDLKEHRTEKAVKAAGRLRAEGKAYRVRDGDILYFLFNV